MLLSRHDLYHVHLYQDSDCWQKKNNNKLACFFCLWHFVDSFTASQWLKLFIDVPILKLLNCMRPLQSGFVSNKLSWWWEFLLLMKLSQQLFLVMKGPWQRMLPEGLAENVPAILTAPAHLCHSLGSYPSVPPRGKHRLVLTFVHHTTAAANQESWTQKLTFFTYHFEPSSIWDELTWLDSMSLSASLV